MSLPLRGLRRRLLGHALRRCRLRPSARLPDPRYLDEVAHLLDLSAETGRHRSLDHRLVVVQTHGGERATHPRLVPDAAPHLLDSHYLAVLEGVRRDRA